MSLPNILDNPILIPSTYRTHHRLDSNIVSPNRSWASMVNNNNVDEIESLDKSDDDSDDESENKSDKIYYQKLIH